MTVAALSSINTCPPQLAWEEPITRRSIAPRPVAAGHDVTPRLIDAILAPDGLSTLFQPIFQVRNGGLGLYGLECLARGPAGSSLEAADSLFAYARRHHEEPLVDRACVATALRQARHLPGTPPLSLNVHASTLCHDSSFAEYLEKTAGSAGIPPARLTVEVIEHADLAETGPFLAAVDRLRRRGIAVGLDEIGRGLSNYRLLLACRPRYFKIDRLLVRGCQADAARLAVIRSIVATGRKLAAEVVATGVESRSDLQALTGVGVRVVQGYVFSRPLAFQDLLANEFIRACLMPVGLEASEPLTETA